MMRKTVSTLVRPVSLLAVMVFVCYAISCARDSFGQEDLKANSEKVLVILQPNPANIRAGESFDLKVTFRNDTKQTVWCAADYAKGGPGGTLPDGRHVYHDPDWQPLLPGPKCLFPLGKKATTTSEVVSGRYYGMWQNFRTEWVPVAPGKSRSASFPVWGIRFGLKYVRVSKISSGTYSCRATVRYKTDGPKSTNELVVESEPIEIKYIGKEPNH